MIGKDRESRAAADLEDEARGGTPVGATLGGLGATDRPLAADVPPDVAVTTLHIGVGEDVQPVLTRVITRETAEEAETACNASEKNTAGSAQPATRTESLHAAKHSRRLEASERLTWEGLGTAGVVPARDRGNSMRWVSSPALAF